MPRSLLAGIAVILFLALQSPALAARTPNTGRVDPDHVTNEELYVIASWENSPLLTDENAVSHLLYPVESKAADCSARGCTNGCTIGFGYNLGAHPADKVRADFAAAGIAPATAERFVPFAGKTGSDAVALCGSTATLPDDLTLTHAQAWELLRIMTLEHKEKVVRRARSEGLLHRLNAGQFAVLVALDYQNPVLCSEAHYLWLQLAAGDTRAVYRNIRYHMGVKFAPGLANRRRWEANYFRWAAKLQRRDSGQQLGYAPVPLARPAPPVVASSS